MSEHTQNTGQPTTKTPTPAPTPPSVPRDGDADGKVNDGKASDTPAKSGL